MIEISGYIDDISSISDRPDTITTDGLLTDISPKDYFGQRLVKPTKIWKIWLLMGFEPNQNERCTSFHLTYHPFIKYSAYIILIVILIILLNFFKKVFFILFIYNLNLNIILHYSINLT